MSSQRDTVKGRTALVIGHCAGMMDMAGLPIWVGMVLIGRMGLDPQRAGSLATLFLLSVVVSSLYFAPRVNHVRREHLVPLAYAIAGLAFVAMNFAQGYAQLAVMHSLAGLAIGCGLSLVHGTMGESANPQRIASIAFTTMCCVGTLFVGVQPPLIERFGASAFFVSMAAVMFTCVLTTAVAFPRIAVSTDIVKREQSKLPRHVWFGMAGVSMLTLNHAMVFGFLERIGASRGFDNTQIAQALIAAGMVNLVAAAVASAFDRRWSPAVVIGTGPALQGLCCFAIAHAVDFVWYAAAASMCVAMLTVTHMFAFGFLARQDPTGRAVAATPVMVMTGSAIGPMLGGVLAQHWGYPNLGVVGLVIGWLSAASFRACARGARRGMTTGTVPARSPAPTPH